MIKRIVCGVLILFVCAACLAPIAAAVGDASGAPVNDVDFDVDLATVLIIICCSIVSALTLVAAVILAKRNIRN